MGSPRDDLVASIQSAGAQTDGAHLAYQRFRQLTGVPMSAVLRHFDSWRDACVAAGVTPGSSGPENLTGNFSKGKPHAIRQLQQVASRLETHTLSRTMFDSQSPEVCAATVARMFGGWDNALRAAGLERHPLHRDSLSLEVLASDFLGAFREVGRVPTVHQLARRSAHSLDTFSRKFETYTGFKREAIALLLSSRADLSTEERDELAAHLDGIPHNESPGSEPVAAHHRGRHLGFRAFAFAPTYENEVVSLFSVVAQELGFEIVCQRPAFPDCEARRVVDPRRKRYKPCFIEFELKSRDYLRHKHPLNGCDLVVCWQHDWTDCPLKVLELESVIRRLPGWK